MSDTPSARTRSDPSARTPIQRRADVRLLGPALVAWAVAALALAWPAGVRALVGMVALTVALGLGILDARRSRRAPPSPLRAARGGRRRTVAPALALAVAAVGVVLVASGGHGLVREAGPVLAWADRGVRVQAQGVVLQEPRVLGPGLDGAERVVLRVGLETVTARGVTAQVTTPVLVLGPQEWAEASWRREVTLSGRLRPAQPGDDVVAVLQSERPEALGEPGPLLAGIESTRARLREVVDPLPDDPRGLLPGLVIGDTSLTPPDLTDAMLATGMSHLSAVSGSNVTLVIGGVLVVCAWCGLGRRARVPIALLALIAFVLLCRPEPSVLRAGVMGAVGLVAVLAARRGVALAALGTAILVLLLADPWLARAPGFALSTLATLGLVVLARPWGEAMARHLPRWARPVGYALAIPVAAQLMVGPVVVVLQENVAPIAVVTNLLAAPLVAPSTLAGVVATILGMVHPGLGTLVAWVGAVPTAGIAAIARWGAGAPLPLSTIAWPGGLGGAMLLAVVSLAVLLCGPWLIALVRRRPLPAAVALVLAVTAWVLVPAPGVWHVRDWRVAACDVGQGDALVLASGPTRGVLVDTGPDPALVRACLDDLGVETLDAVVLTHDHADHTGGLAGVLGSREVGEVVVPAGPTGPALGSRSLAALRDAEVPVRPVDAGDHLVWGDVDARTLGPPGRRPWSPEEANDSSVVLDVTVGEGGTTVLLTGDLEPEGQRAVLRLIGPGTERVYDVLKVAHHGSGAQEEDFLRRVRGRVSVISVGEDNDYGHPAPDVVATLRGEGSLVLRTDLDGAVAIGGTGPGLWVTTEER